VSVFNRSTTGESDLLNRRQALHRVARSGLALGAVALVAGVTPEAGAVQGAEVVGSWITTIRLDDGEEDIHMMSLLQGGVLLFSGEGPIIPSPFPGLDEFWFNPGHGAWRQAGGEVEGHFVVVVQDRNQRPVFLCHVRPELMLQGPDALTGRMTFYFVPVGATDPALSLEASAEASRVTV
jgi:hypothetical protein